MSELTVGQLKGLTVNSNTITVPSGHSLAVPTLKGDSSGTITIPSGQKLYAPGSVVQVQHVQSSATKYTVSAADIAAIPELSISFTPKFSNSKILLQAMINSSATYVCTFGFLKNGSAIISNTNTNSAGSISTTYYGGGAVESNIYNNYISYMDTPATTSAITYAAAVSSSWSGTNYTVHINDRSDSTMRSISTLTIMEVAQ